MPRQIISQDPITRPVEPEKYFGDVKMTIFQAFFIEGQFRAIVHLKPYDYGTDEVYDTNIDYTYTFDDFEQQMQQSPKLTRAWNDINDVMGLAYDFYRLKEKVQEAIAAGEDQAVIDALITARNVALDALRAPLP